MEELCTLTMRYNYIMFYYESFYSIILSSYIPAPFIYILAVE